MLLDYVDCNFEHLFVMIMRSHFAQDKAVLGSNSIGLGQRCVGLPNLGES